MQVVSIIGGKVIFQSISLDFARELFNIPAKPVEKNVFSYLSDRIPRTYDVPKSRMWYQELFARAMSNTSSSKYTPTKCLGCALTKKFLRLQMLESSSQIISLECGYCHKIHTLKRKLK